MSRYFRKLETKIRSHSRSRSRSPGPPPHPDALPAHSQDTLTSEIGSDFVHVTMPSKSSDKDANVNANRSPATKSSASSTPSVPPSATPTPSGSTSSLTSTSTASTATTTPSKSSNTLTGLARSITRKKSPIPNTRQDPTDEWKKAMTARPEDKAFISNAFTNTATSTAASLGGGAVSDSSTTSGTDTGTGTSIHPGVPQLPSRTAPRTSPLASNSTTLPESATASTASTYFSEPSAQAREQVDLLLSVAGGSIPFDVAHRVLRREAGDMDRAMNVILDEESYAYQPGFISGTADGNGQNDRMDVDGDGNRGVAGGGGGDGRRGRQGRSEHDDELELTGWKIGDGPAQSARTTRTDRTENTKPQQSVEVRFDEDGNRKITWTEGTDGSTRVEMDARGRSMTKSGTGAVSIGDADIAKMSAQERTYKENMMLAGEGGANPPPSRATTPIRIPAPTTGQRQGVKKPFYNDDEMIDLTSDGDDDDDEAFQRALVISREDNSSAGPEAQKYVYREGYAPQYLSQPQNQHRDASQGQDRGNTQPFAYGGATTEEERKNWESWGIDDNDHSYTNKEPEKGSATFGPSNREGSDSWAMVPAGNGASRSEADKSRTTGVGPRMSAEDRQIADVVAESLRQAKEKDEAESRPDGVVYRVDERPNTFRAPSTELLPAVLALHALLHTPQILNALKTWDISDVTGSPHPDMNASANEMKPPPLRTTYVIQQMAAYLDLSVITAMEIDGYLRGITDTSFATASASALPRGPRLERGVDLPEWRSPQDNVGEMTANFVNHVLEHLITTLRAARRGKERALVEEKARRATLGSGSASSSVAPNAPSSSTSEPSISAPPPPPFPTSTSLNAGAREGGGGEKGGGVEDGLPAELGPNPVRLVRLPPVRVPVSASGGSLIPTMLAEMQDSPAAPRIGHAPEVLVLYLDRSVPYSINPASVPFASVPSASSGAKSALGTGTEGGKGKNVDVIDVDAIDVDEDLGTGRDEKRFTYPERLYLDAFLEENRDHVDLVSIERKSREEEGRKLEDRKKALIGFAGKDTRASLKTSIYHFENVASGREGTGTAERARNEAVAQKLQDVLTSLEGEVIGIDKRLAQLKAEWEAAGKLEGLKKHPYNLRAVLAHDGLYGRRNLAAFTAQPSRARSSASGSDHGLAIKRGTGQKWWKTTDWQTSPASAAQALHDPAGQHHGAGPYMLIYSRTLPFEPGSDDSAMDEDHDYDVEWLDLAVKNVREDVAEMLQSQPEIRMYTKPDAMVGGIRQGIGHSGNQDGDGDFVMGSESQATVEVIGRGRSSAEQRTRKAETSRGALNN